MEETRWGAVATGVFLGNSYHSRRFPLFHLKNRRIFTRFPKNKGGPPWLTSQSTDAGCWQWQPIQMGADFCDGSGIRMGDLEIRLDRLGPRTEEGYCLVLRQRHRIGHVCGAGDG